MKTFRILASLALYLALVTHTANAAGGAQPWSDSLNTEALNGGPGLQQVLDSLGYSINVASDEVPLQLFAPYLSGSSGEATLLYRSSASTSAFGWYAQGAVASKSQLFSAGATVGSHATFNYATGDSLGLYLGPTLYDDTWFTETSQNWDAYRHIKVFPAGSAGRYVIAWEDLPDGGDQDFQDYIVEVRFQDPNELFLTFDGSSYINVCEPDTICFQVNGAGGVGSLTLAQLDNGIPTTLTSGLSPVTYRFCFIPTSYAIEDYQFIFRLSDQGANVVTDTFNVHLHFQNMPVITNTVDFTDTMLCSPDTICFMPLTVTDPDNDVVKYTLLDGPGVIDSTTGVVCFLPADVDSADYRFIVMASDSCCYSLPLPRVELPCPRDTVVYRVFVHHPPVITTIPDTTINLCKLDPVCFPVTAGIPGGPTVPVFQDCGPGTIANGQLCFTPDAAGAYTFCFYANDECGGVVRDTVQVTITLNHPPVANAGRDSTLSQCTPAQICWNAGCSDPDGDLQSCALVEGPGTYNGTKICFTPTASGIYTFVLEATDLCGESDLDTAIINVHVDLPPVAVVHDTTVNLCAPAQVCLPASCSDPDNDLTSCNMISGQGTYDGANICFTPTASGSYQFILKAIDACGRVGYDTGYATVTINRPPVVTTGGGNYKLCAPETICVPIVASDPDGDNLTFTTTMGKVVGNTVCMWSGGEGRRQLAYNVIATDPCGIADTALYLVNVLVNMVPVIQVPTQTAQNICDPTQLCFSVSAIDSIMGKLGYSLLTGPGTINPSTGQVCFTPQNAGTFNWKIVVTDSCGAADTGNVSWQINLIGPPGAVIVPPAVDTVVCLGDTIGNYCVNVTYPDPQLNTAITVVPSDPGLSWSFGYSAGSGQLCFQPPVDVSKTYAFTFYRVNECHDTTASQYSFDVTYDRCDSACMVLSIEQTPCITLGSQVNVDITLTEGKLPIGGFDLLVGYDVTAFTFIQASLGGAINQWEYFTYRLGPFGNCGSGCPSGMVRLVALADQNNGAAHPPASQFYPDGVIAVLTFRVTQNSTFAGLTYPVDFYWVDCGDNGVSSVSGDTLLIDKTIYGTENLLWDEYDEINYPEANRPTGMGAPDSCIVGDKKLPIRCIDFHNGSICIIDNDSIDARGDMNLNGVANEIADAVLYTNYFLKGISAFTLSVAAQTAASDVNNDGRTLTVGDLIYMLRIITGDALPIPKLSPFAERVDFQTKTVGDGTAISIDSPTPLGGVYLQVRTTAATQGEIMQSLNLSQMDVRTSVDGDLLNIVAYSSSKGAVIPAGNGELLTVPGQCEITHVEASDYYGNMMNAQVSKASVPSEFQLGQNYPNPFNPTTTIKFSVPVGSDWTLSIINVNGQVVKRFAGATGFGNGTVTWDATDQSGQHVATGVYFYRLDAGSFSETRKMVLMK